MIEPQLLTLVEAVLLLASNLAGGALASLAWAVADVDVREARRWEPPSERAAERARLKHNRLVITEDARYGEARRLLSHGLIAVIGLFWLLTPQPVNPMVVWWAVAIRAVAVVLSLVLIDKTVHHLEARYRFDKPWMPEGRLRHFWPALKLAWRDMRAARRLT